MNETRSSVCHAACDGWCSVSTTATADDAATALTFWSTAKAEADLGEYKGNLESYLVKAGEQLRAAVRLSSDSVVLQFGVRRSGGA